MGSWERWTICAGRFLAADDGTDEENRRKDLADQDQALAGRSDFIEVNSIDLWLGGAHLTADNLWRWDEQNRKLIRA